MTFLTSYTCMALQMLAHHGLYAFCYLIMYFRKGIVLCWPGLLSHSFLVPFESVFRRKTAEMIFLWGKNWYRTTITVPCIPLGATHLSWGVEVKSTQWKGVGHRCWPAGTFEHPHHFGSCPQFPVSRWYLEALVIFSSTHSWYNSILFNQSLM